MDAYARGGVTSPRHEQDDLTDAEAIACAATGTRRRAERGSARLLQRLQRYHPERTPQPKYSCLDDGWMDWPADDGAQP
jgi:hypothetical protein